MVKFDISILITTYNRSKYLKHLLENIKDGISDLDFNFEILISIMLQMMRPFSS